MPARMHPVGEQGPAIAGGEIDPQARPSKAGMAERRLRAALTAGPALMLHLPAEGARRTLLLAHERQRRMAEPGRGQEAEGEVEHGVDAAEEAGMAGKAAQRK